ncbi:phospholipase D-like domain-containing protein [Paraliomyxa miuraensis]|uniref:hypothetical protein n=1 Tax=Paraliomyxa miuraensis TaxID=376150 RepID=UPI0022503917|nr:hypothetical protein [Paraliomyxa miuraensis]MCX4239402.1 hypothetical protein [Paraliomyxa miuraensis]
MSSDPQTQVLSQALESAIGEARVRVAVFVSFQLDPAFFEHSILPILFRRGFSDNEAVRRAQLDEALRELEHVAVYYDRSGLITQHGPARLDYRRIGLSVPGGVLHAKHVFLLLEDPGEPPQPRLVMLTTSANLTRSGWWSNVEVGHVYEIRPDTKDLLREDLLGPGGLFAYLLRLDRTGGSATDRHGKDANHGGIDRLRAFLKQHTTARTHRSHEGRLHSRLWHGEVPLPEFLAEHVPEGCRLEVISPFVDDVEETPTLCALIEAVRPTATRVLLPRDENQRATCRKEYVEAVRMLPKVTWGTLPTRLTSFGKGETQSRHRYVHAKIYRLFSPSTKTELLLVGSPNLTGAAHRGAKSGNLETAILLDRSGAARLDWWLERLEDLEGMEFRPLALEDRPLESVLPITLRFDWKSGELRYYWEQRRQVPSAFSLAAGGRPLARVEGIVVEEWALVPADADTLRDVMRSGAFLDVAVDEDPPQRVLVQEVGMEHKPSLLHDLTPEQILEYWSMLTTEQQDAFLEREIFRQVGREGDGQAPPPIPEGDSMFDRFAGIFHAFSCLREHLDDALERHDASGERQAIYRLFGRRHDSLRSLVDKLATNADGDPVLLYISLLCAQEVVRWVRTEHPTFASTHADDLDELEHALQASHSIRERFSFGEAADRERFLDWLEEMFFLPIRAPEAPE